MKLHLFALVFILSLTGCPLDSGGEDKDWALPPSVGANQVGGTTWYTLDVKVDYTADGTYTRSVSLRNTFDYRPLETGAYSWNETDKIIHHKPKTVLFNPNIINAELLDRKKYRQAIEEQINGWDWFPGWIASQDFTKNEYIASRMDAAFAGWAAEYTLIADALLMQKALPKNVEPDDVSGKTFQHREDPAEYCQFEKNGDALTCTFDGTTIEWVKRIITGAFTYDGRNRKVYIKPATVDGKTMLVWYNSVEPYEGHGYPNDAYFKAAQTNTEFQLIEKSYNLLPQGQYQGTVNNN